MNKNIAGLALAMTAASMVTGCSLLGTTLDYGKVESAITDKLNTEYTSLGQKVDSVTCPKAEKKPAPGSKFTCAAKVGDATVPVEVTVKDKDMNVDYITTKKLYSLDKVGPQLAPEVSKQLKETVTVDCGTGFKAVETGGTFTCKVKNAEDATGKLTLTVGSMTGTDNWAIEPD